MTYSNLITLPIAQKMLVCNGPLVSIELILPPVSLFCSGAAPGRHLMVSDEDRPANLETRV